jgi:hypothetical protein
VSPSFNLSVECRDFADTLTAVLNRTVCNGVRMSRVEIANPPGFQIGYEIEKRDLTGRGIPLSLGRRPATLFIGLSYHLAPDEWGKHLMVTTSFMGLFTDSDMTQALLHYDYERHKRDGYPEAHLQVCAESAQWLSALAACGRPSTSPEKLHLPVGGRRYRPSLEDLIQLVASEDLCDTRPGWEDLLNQSRDAFQEKQLRAAVRRNPEVAADALEDLEYGVMRPLQRKK